MHLLNRANRPYISATAAAVQAPMGGRVADLGFGGGYGLRLLLDQVGPAGTVYGVDASPTALALAQRRLERALRAGRLELHHTTMWELPFADAALDGAATSNTLHYIDDDELGKSFTEVARTLRSGARFVVGVGDPAYIARLPFREGMLNRPLSDVTALIEGAGLRICDHQQIGRFHFHVYVATA